MKVDREFERPRVNDRPVGGGEADAGAGVGRAREQERAGESIAASFGRIERRSSRLLQNSAGRGEWRTAA